MERIPASDPLVAEFLRHDHSPEMKRYVDGLKGFAVDLDMPEYWVHLLGQIDAAFDRRH